MSFDDKTMDVNECPLCMEPFDLDDIGFFPCSCGYQVCRFCWHRLKNDENGLCPACRQVYPESPVGFNASVSIEAIEELKKKNRRRNNKDKAKVKEMVKNQNLASIRVVQKNLVFVMGLPQRLTQEDLRREFAKYGKILKLVVNSASTSAYVTFARPEDAIAAIKSLNGSGKKNGSNSSIRASLGTTKYCSHWLRSMACPKIPDCMYLHELAEPEASFTKEEMQTGKHNDYEKRLIQHYLNIINKEQQQRSQQQQKKKDEMNNSENNIIKKEIIIAKSNSNSDLSNGSNVLRNGHQSEKSFALPGDLMDSHSRDSNDSTSSSSSSQLISTINEPSLNGDKSPDNQSEEFVDCLDNDDDVEEDEVEDDDDDDGLDFDPISISINKLQDLSREPEQLSLPDRNHVNLQSNFYQQQQAMQQQRQQNVVWRDSLRAMFPNVNITFQNSSQNAQQQQRQQQQQQQQQQQRNFYLQQQQIQNTPNPIQTQQQQFLLQNQTVPFWQHNQELLLRRQYARFQQQQQHQQQQQQQQQQMQMEFQQGRYQLPMRQPPPGFNL